jgi:hypothetical protein
VCILLFGTIPAEPAQWIALDGSDAGREVGIVQSEVGVARLEVALEVPGIELRPLEAEGMAFTELEVPGTGRIGEPGEPMLPALRRFVEIPQGASVTATATVLETATVELADRGLSPTVYPVQLPLPKCDCPEQRAWRFSYDPAAYAAEVRHPLVSVSEPFTVRDHRMVMLTVAPVAYDPTAGTLQVAQRARVELRFEGADVAATRQRKARLASRHFDDFLTGATLNLNFGGRTADWAYPSAAPIEFLIITPPQFVAGLQPFVDWKTTCGYRMTVTTTDVAGTTTTAIKSYISGLYNGATPPVYILMIGDSPSPLPTYEVSSGGIGGTDLPFVQMDGDLYPDMMIARWPVDDTTELANMRDKTLFYEQPTAANSAWLNRALYLGGDDYPSWGMTTHQDIMAYLMQPAPNNAECDYWNGETQNPTTAQLIADLNTGRGWCVYSAHCGPYEMSGDPKFRDTDVPNLANSSMYPLGFGHCCQSNMWNDYSDVFGEVVVTQANKGFVSYWGGSNSTYWDEDDWLERGFFDSLFDADMSGTSINLDRQYSHLAACYAGLTEVTLHGGNEHYYWHCYNLNGDPTLDPFTRAPIAMTVGVDPVAPPAADDSFTVTVTDPVVGAVEGALVGVSQNGVLLGAGFTDASGQAVFHIDEPAPGADMLVRATAHNHLPTDASVMVGAGSDGLVLIDGSLYRCDSQVGIDVYDDDLAGQGTLQVTLTAVPTGATGSATLTEVAGEIVLYHGVATLGADLVADGASSFTVTYHDLDTGGGGPEDKVVGADLDCAGPVISGVALGTPDITSVVVSWTTDEPGDSRVEVLPDGAVVTDSELTTDHQVVVDGLASCATYRLNVGSADHLGNLGTTGPTDPFTTLEHTVALEDDVESGAGGWVVTTPVDSSALQNWEVSVDAGAPSPTHVWHTAGEPGIKDDRLAAGPFTLGEGWSELSFWHYYRLEYDATARDGGVLEVSTDGSTWQDVEDAGGVFLEGGYNATLSSCCGNPLGGRRGWSGYPSSYRHVVVDLSALAGQQVWFRFRLGCDWSYGDGGWSVDEILLHSASTCVDLGALFVDGFESGDCTQWDWYPGAP